MAQRPETQSRPSQTQDVILRLQQCGQEEAEALRSLCHCMIEIFKDNPKPSYIAEAAAISAVKDVELASLVITFSNVISQGTADGNIKERDLLNAFVYVLWHAKEPSMRSKLGTVLDCLYKRLKAADARAETETQYELVGCLSKVLDAMVEIRFEGLDRETVHAPLLKLLAKLAKSKELRLTQAASYAIQGLRGVPDNEGPWQTVWRYSQSVITIGTKAAGAVTTMDPTKIIDAIPNMMELLEGLKFGLEHASEALKQGTELKESFNGLWLKAKSWYHALRYTELLLQCHAWNQFRQLLKVVPCRDQEDFLCGVFAQLEIAWVIADRAGEVTAKNAIIELFRSVPESKQQIVLEWRNLVANTLGESCIEIKMSRLTFLQKHYLSSLKFTDISAMAPALNTNTSPLLEQAWQKCIEAKLFYADTKIRGFYLNGDRLDIKRLSGDVLSMENCYINLAIISGQNQEQESSFSLDARLRTEVVSTDQVALEEFFNSRELANGRNVLPKRVLVKGRAGVGKTTLCKKIVYEFLHGLWKDMFTRILWLPLRKLKGRTYNLKSMIHAEYFGDCIEDDHLSEALARKLADPLTEHKTLYLLDGLDEVTQEWDTDTPEYRFLQSLLHKPYVITTSRPYGMKDTKFDLELETIGFQPEQVEMYLERCVNKAAVSAIQNFLMNKPLIQSLVRIPIQLDALCYCWEAMEASAEPAPTTMTMLYEVLWRELWRKDLHRLGIYTESRARDLAIFEIDHQSHSGQSLLEWFAFQGLRAGIIDFTSKHQEFLTSTWNKLGGQPPQLYRRTLDESSFMRSSEMSSARDRTYYFLHLTFQEFFAAKYFARHWQCNTRLIELDLEHKTERTLSTIELIQNEKYNPRFNIFWRFVTGLIQMQPDVSIQSESLDEPNRRKGSQDIVNFFAQIHAQPIDLLEAAHHRLLMYCLNEVASSGQMEETQKLLRKGEEDLLREWIITGWKLNYSFHFFSDQSEFPEMILRDLLQDDELIPYSEVLGLLSKRYLVDPETLQAVSNLTSSKHKIRVRIQAILLIFQFPKLASGEIMSRAIRIFQSFLDNEEIDYKELRFLHMDQDQHPPEEVISAMIKALKDSNKDSRLRSLIAEWIRNLGSLDEKFVDIMTEMIRDKDPDIQNCIVEVLGEQSHLPEKTIDAVTAALSDRESDVRIIAIRILGAHSPKRYPTLLEKIFVGLITLLSDKVLDVRIAAAEALRDMAFLSQKSIAILIAMVDDQQWEVRMPAIIALSGHSPFSEKMMSTLVSMPTQESSNPEWDSAIYNSTAVLERQPPLSEVFVNTLITMLKDIEPPHFAANILVTQKSLPEQAIDSLIIALTDENPKTQGFASSILQKQSSLSEKAVADIIRKMKEGGVRVQKYAATTLGNKAILPEEAITIMTTMLMNEDSDIKRSAAWGLEQQSSLPERTVIALITALRDGCHEALYTLYEQTSLTQEALTALISILPVQPALCYYLWCSHNAHSLMGDLDNKAWRYLCYYWFEYAQSQGIGIYECDGSIYIISDETAHQISTNPVRTQELLRILQDVKSKMLDGVSPFEEDSDEDSE